MRARGGGGKVQWQSPPEMVCIEHLNWAHWKGIKDISWEGKSENDAKQHSEMLQFVFAILNLDAKS